MSDKKVTPRDNVKYEKVVLEKIGPHVEIYGPYTKRGLRRLLLSSISLYPDKDNQKETLKQIGLNEQDLKNIKNDQQLSEKTQRTLQDLEITKDMILKAKSKKSKEYLRKDNKKRGENVTHAKEAKDKKYNKDCYEKGKGDKNVRKREKSIRSAKENFIEHLKQRGISNDLMARLLRNGLTEETIRLLQALGFSTDKLENLQKLWQIVLSENDDDECSGSTILEPSSSDEYMSLDSLYLKSYISVPIKKALREIILRKPKDPVEFLGQWLLHFKVYEEREIKLKECEIELTTEREKLKLKRKFEMEANYINENYEEESEENLEET
ncbi:uncharacterized protein LOC117171674 isoform X2 [Belonocnema kinseyi]|uniref:uncharacterized protein LOC117171674 isoform X2 n=1 Tax=Belonocnema kinseyi TaxID=2817044 RepID=UPI00143CE301|nr:uncharacterized protein LOC117171674 isoform X2 [Belonocnema kinseyi]